MSDQSLVLLAILDSNRRLGNGAVNRTTLVKQVFLAEILRPLYRIWEQHFNFFKYNHGPYSDEIFTKLDTLMFNGLVTAERFRKSRSRIEGRYTITVNGIKLLEKTDQPQILSLSRDLIWALQTLGIEQSNSICKLVYEESEFAQVLADHARRGIPSNIKGNLPAITKEGNETFIALSILKQLQKSVSLTDVSLSLRETTRLFLTALALRAARHRSTN
ncbi:hypothetical protein [Luteolibacter luteus]|uniref:Uncharacterized protein n=1 Tax=Luteolibacter luteus TaxID=2728835 RepID=A0A858RDK1_9BACT|nr:hypothetical protein [Luteolibacter luteus]QJE94785.1 hypothetical protein HHL09_02985 [Luteolibacter luteus]